jgi:hypothetical protein
MNKDLLLDVNIVDESGSMNTIKKDAIGGYDGFIKSQKEQPGRTKVITVTFSNEHRIVEDNVDVADVKSLGEYFSPRGSTALLDTLGFVIDKVGADLAALPEEERPGKVLFTILTDGDENASKTFTREQIFEKITHQKEVYGWEFLFLAANQDAISSGASLGMSPQSCINFDSTAKGVSTAYTTMNSCVNNYRNSGSLKWDARDIK